MLFFPPSSTVIWGASRIVAGASRCSQTCRQHIQACRQHFEVVRGALNVPSGALRHSQTYYNRCMVLLYLSSEIPIILKSRQNALLGSDTPLSMTSLSLHATSIQRFLEASSDKNSFCWSNSCQGHAIHIWEDTIWSSNCLITRIGSCSNSVCLISLRRKYYLLDVLLKFILMQWQ
jgi:hypothetical protein